MAKITLIRSDALPNVSALTGKKDTSEKTLHGASHLAKTTQVVPSDGALEYTPNYICWLDAQARKKRRKRFSTQASGSMKLSQLRRSVGRHLERLEPHAFRIVWSAHSVCIDYELPDGQNVNETLSNEKLS
jgi:hypothetical protein